MGYWGHGTFEGDSPRDYLADMVYVWEKIIDHALAGELNEVTAYFGPEGSRSVAAHAERGHDALASVVMPTVEVMIAVAEKFDCDHLPSPEKVSGWAAEALGLFDAEEGAGWDGAGERRAIVEETFARLSRLAVRLADDGGPRPE